MRNILFNGVNYTIPDTGESGWGTNTSDYLQAISTAALSKAGGLFTLAAELDFGNPYGIKASYIKSRATNLPTSGFIRLANSDTIVFRNVSNTGNLALGVDSSNRLTFNGVPVGGGGGSLIASEIGFSPDGYVSGTNVQTAMSQIISRTTNAATLPSFATGYVSNTTVQGAISQIVARTTTAGNIPKVSYGWNTLTNVEESINAIIDRTTNAMFFPSSPYSFVTNTNVQGAITQLADAINTNSTAGSTNATNLSNHIANTSTHGVTGALVGTTDTQTLTNKTISGGNNTITNIPNSSLTGLSVTPTASTIVLRDGSGNIVNNQVQSNSTTLTIKGGSPDGSTSVGVVLDNASSLDTTGSKVVSIRNAGVEKAYIDGVTGGLSLTGPLLGDISLSVPQGSYLNLSGTTLGRYLYADGTYVRSASPIKTTGNVEANQFVGTQFSGTSTTLPAVYNSAINGTSTSIAHKFQTTNSQATTGAKLMAIYNQATEVTSIDKDGYITAPGAIASSTNLSFTIKGAQVAASASADVIFDTTNTRTSGKIASFRNNGVEKAYFDYNGNWGLGNTFVFQVAGGSGAQTINARSGTAIIPVGSSSVTITNNLILGANAIVYAMISDTTANTGLTQIVRVSAATGSFTIYGNANAATSTVNIKWSIVYTG